MRRDAISGCLTIRMPCGEDSRSSTGNTMHTARSAQWNGGIFLVTCVARDHQCNSASTGMTTALNWLMPTVALKSPATHGFTVLRSSPEMYREVQKCRICGNRDLAPVLSLGKQYLTGVFPNVRGAALSRGPLELVACNTAR